LPGSCRRAGFGGLSRATTRTLDQLGRGETLTVPARPGMRLVREWQGRVHVVTVGEDQVVRWEERPYRSLSEPWALMLFLPASTEPQTTRHRLQRQKCCD
jgi:hypothetical protein